MTQQLGSHSALGRPGQEPSFLTPELHHPHLRAWGVHKESPVALGNLRFQEGLQAQPLSKQAAETEAAPRNTFAFLPFGSVWDRGGFAGRDGKLREKGVGRKWGSGKQGDPCPWRAQVLAFPACPTAEPCPPPRLARGKQGCSWGTPLQGPLRLHLWSDGLAGSESASHDQLS